MKNDKSKRAISHKTYAKVKKVLIGMVEEAYSTGLKTNGKNEIANGKVVVVAGGGNEVEFLKDAFDEGVKVVITGVSSRNDYSEKEHTYEEKHQKRSRCSHPQVEKIATQTVS